MTEAVHQAPLPSPLSRPKAAFNGHTGYFPGAETQGESSAQANGHTTSSTTDHSRLAPIDIRQQAPVGDWQTEGSRIGESLYLPKQSAPTHTTTGDHTRFSKRSVPRHRCQASTKHPLMCVQEADYLVRRTYSTKGQPLSSIIQPRKHITRSTTSASATFIRQSSTTTATAATL